MKPDLLLALEHAGWPALLVDAAGVIRNSNQAAVKLFGPAVQGASSDLSAIWGPGNSQTPEELFAQWKQSAALVVPVRFRSQEGAAVSCFTSVCAVTKEDHQYFLLQLLPESAPALPAAKSQTAEAGLAHKQKLECALQLARTVSLDFNNALTSILGHTSLVLSKMEPTHPWRGSLMEVEKSASKAAEIANDLGTFSRQDKEVRTQAAGNLTD